MQVIVGIAGKHGAGKDTLGAFLIEELKKLGIDAQRFAFADELKEVAKAYFDWDGNKEENVVTRAPTADKICYTAIGGRALLQGIGVMLRDLVYSEYWITQTISKIMNWFYYNDKYLGHRIAVVTDVRFINEAKTIAKCKGSVIQILRDGTATSNHPSETEQDSEEFKALVHTTITNNKNLKYLRLRAQALAESIGNRYMMLRK